jgi:hypothetical protein
MHPPHLRVFTLLLFVLIVCYASLRISSQVTIDAHSDSAAVSSNYDEETSKTDYKDADGINISTD